jgi:hypothetical protein
LLVGRESPLFEVREAAQHLGVADSVRVAGYAPRADYENYIAAADICLNLRYPSAGETSASLLRLLGAGKVTFVTRAAASLELPNDVCVKIEADAFEQPLLVEYLNFFSARPDARAAMGERARAFVRENHTLEGAAQGYREFLESVRQCNAASRSWMQKWERKAPVTRSSTTRSNGQAASPAVHSLAPDDVKEISASDWRDAVAQAYAALGLSTADPLLRELAQAITELGLHQQHCD